MISIDKGLVGAKPLGDVVERHRKYGEFVDRLDIIVLSFKGYRVCELSGKVKAFPTNSFFKLFYYFDALRIGKELFKKNYFDLIVTQDPFITGAVGLKLKKLFSSKLLIHFHGDFPVVGVKNADAIRVMSNGQKDKLVNAGINENKIRVIATPIEIEKFISPLSPPPSNSAGRHEGGRRGEVLYVGRLSKEKNVGLLISAGKKIKALIQIVGAGPEEGKLKAQAKDCDNIEFLGQIPSDKLPELYARAQVFVLPSNTESFGKVLAEANASGKPVVATATTGAKEIIKDGYNGFLVPVGDAKALADKILFLLDNPEKAKEMGENGRKLVIEKYSDNTKKIIDFWKDIIR